ncbi:MAG TPA: SRPBCC family protein [Nocardioides sp.]|uniref:SRPBCC family protein n=1 Tax=Nocardioides sp. TaxID=35761 RepID=UPI002E3401AE|nr:SRPBCC family protein [Nocardioides sp.]HEX5090203.1 SRPBCC family protein [Nocardioides sp.]
MLIKNEFEVAQPVDKVWEFFEDVPGVAACLPGAELTDDLGEDRYAGRVGVRMGPVKLEFAGKAHVRERDDDARRIVIDAAGSDAKNRGSAEMTVTARLSPGSGGGTRVAVDQDLQISGAAAQYGRGMISDVTSVLMRQFATNMQQRIAAIERGESTVDLGGGQASGFAIGLRAAQLALMRVIRRFFMPYDPSQFPSRGGA